jgi:hypothetical protein
MICQQIPSVLEVIRHLGMFYYWHVWETIPVIKTVCMPWS